MVQLDQRAVKRVVEPSPNRELQRRGCLAEQRCIKDTELNRQPCLCSSLPLTLIPYFQKDQHEGKQQRPHYYCYHFQTAIFQAKANLGTLVYDVCAWACIGKQHSLFHRSPCVYLCWLSSLRVIFCQLYCSQQVHNPRAALPSAVPQLRMDLAGHGHSGRWSHPHIEVMKENSVPHTPTHGHRDKEAPRGHTDWRLRSHSLSWQDEGWLLSQWWCQAVLPTATNARLWSAPQPLRYSSLSMPHLYLFMSGPRLHHCKWKCDAGLGDIM